MGLERWEVDSVRITMISISREAASAALIALMSNEVRYQSELRRTAPREYAGLREALEETQSAMTEIRAAIYKQ